MENLGSKAAEYLKAKVRPSQGAAERGLWTYIENKKNDGIESRRTFEQQWLLNMAFVAGRQYTFFNSSAHTVQNLTPVPGRVWITDNQLMPRVRRQIADFIKNDPIMSVVPSTTEDEDIQAARAGDKFLKSFWQSNRMKRKIRQLAGWIYNTGNGFLDHRWDRKLGPIEMDPQTGEMKYAGDVDVGVWGPFDIVVPMVTMGDIDLHVFPWLIKMKWRSLEYLKENYGEEGAKVQEESMAKTLIDSSFLLGGGQGTQVRKFPGAMLIEFYQKPCEEFPKGLFCPCANGIVFTKFVSDYPFDKYNLEHFKDIDVPGQFWGKATAQDAIPLQRTWNQTLSDINEYNRTMGRGKYLIPEKSGVRFEFDNVTGQHIYYKPVMGLKPELLTLKNIPASFQQILSMTALSLNGLFSQHEITQGTNKSDIRSGEMVALLREQDSQGMIPAYAIFEEGLENLMEGVLKRVQKGYTQQRMIKITGRDDEIEVMAFGATDLRDNTNVTVKKQSSLPDSRIAREAMIMQRFQQGLYGLPQDPEVRRHVMTMLDDAIVKDIYSGDRRDEAVARWENTLLVRGIKLVINIYDNHQIHDTTHSSFRKGLDYQKLKIMNPKAFAEIEANFLAHQMQHQKILAAQREAMLKEQIALGGPKAAPSGAQGKGVSQ
jgi:hypothetical protein